MGENVWGEQEMAFQALKDILCNESLLQYPDFEENSMSHVMPIPTGWERVEPRNYW
jgi:hypothetical protein